MCPKYTQKEKKLGEQHLDRNVYIQRSMLGFTFKKDFFHIPSMEFKVRGITSQPMYSHPC